MMQDIGPDDLVWDVGANVGFYTQAFADKGAQVIAFEPSPQSIEELRNVAQGRANVIVQNVALSSAAGTADFFVRPNGYSVAESMVRPQNVDTEVHQVKVRRGDEFECPTKAKIDVEGFELEVLGGMGEHLRNPRLKALFIEVHFQILENRGLKSAPVQIVSMLKAAGFRIRWPDPSHIYASR